MIYSFILYLLIYILYIIELLALNILPLKYLIVSISIFLIIFLIFIYLSKKNKVLKIIVFILNNILTIIMLIITIYLMKTNSFLNNLDIEDDQVISFYLMTNNTSEKINKVGIINDFDPYYETAIEELKKKYSGIKIIVFENEDDLLKSLSKKEISHIFVSILYDMKDENLNIVDEIQVKIKGQNEINNLEKSSFNILISGLDCYGDINKVSRSDVNIVMSVNLKTKKILLTHIPRDYYITLDKEKKTKDKLTHVGYYGIDKTSEIIENLLDINIDYYIKLNFDSLINFIDSIGGIDVYSDTSFLNYEKGYNHLNGERALVFSRIRKKFKTGDLKRGENQMEVIKAIVNKVSSTKTILLNYLNIIDSLENKIQINFTKELISKIVKEQIDNMTSFEITTFSLTGFNGKAYTYSLPSKEVYVMIPNEDSIKKASNLIKEIIKL